MANILNPKPVLTVDQRDKHFGVTRRAPGFSDAGFVVYRGSQSAQIVAMFLDEQDALDYAKHLNRKDAAE